MKLLNVCVVFASTIPGQEHLQKRGDRQLYVENNKYKRKKKIGHVEVEKVI